MQGRCSRILPRIESILRGEPGRGFETTGVLGLWEDGDGRLRRRAFPGWATIPSNYNLALSRHWQLTFAWLSWHDPAVCRTAGRYPTVVIVRRGG